MSSEYYLIHSDENNHVSTETVYEFEQIIKSHLKWETKKSFFIFLGKIFNKLKISNILNFIIVKKNLFAVIMSLNEIDKRTFPWFRFRAKSKSVYMFDIWESYFTDVKRIVKEFNIDNLFISAKYSAEILSAEIKNCNIFWIPEGINPQDYKFADYKEKDIDVLQLGRRYNKYHEIIEPFLAAENKTYLYEKIKGEIIFSDKFSFVDGLSRTKISICVPASISNPDSKNRISTMTQRYLQSMASKALIVGFIPDEMKELFDYKPLVEIDFDNPVQQLNSILNNYESYIPLIEKNYQEVILKHTWKNRLMKILTVTN